jgi:hypothetical protein
MTSDSDDNRAAIVCSHIAKDGLPILRAIRSEPLETADSGWQFLCNRGETEREEEAKVWLICKVLALEPSLSPFIDSPIDTTLVRRDTKSNWQREK